MVEEEESGFLDVGGVIEGGWQVEGKHFVVWGLWALYRDSRLGCSGQMEESELA